MAIADYEGSRDSGQQIELWDFVYGEAGQTYRYTDGDRELLYATNLYSPLSIERTVIETKGKLSGREIKVKVPSTSEIAQLFRIFPPGRVVSVVLRQGHDITPHSDDNYGVVWTGRVLEASRSETTTTLTCEALSAGMRKPGLRRHYQWPCPLVLYGTQCGATKTAIPTTVTGITGNKITVTDGFLGAYTAADFIGGMVDWQGSSGTEARGILRVEGTNVIVLAGPPIGLATSDPMNVYLGCPHTLAGCQNLHGNAVNFGGHPWIPTAGNPVNKNTHT